MAETIVKLVLGKLADALANAVVQEAFFNRGVHDMVERVQLDLTLIQSFLKDADIKRHKDERIKKWVNEVEEVGDWIKDALEKLLAEVGGGRAEGFRNIFNIFKRIGKTPKNELRIKIGQIQERLCEIKENTTIYGIERIRSFVELDKDKTEVVGFKVDKKIIGGQLIDTNIMRRAVISIVGNGGSGKTTLAKEVYKSVEVKRHFDISMWLTIPKSFHMIDILMKMLQEIGSERENERGENELTDYLKTKLNKSLRERKYLIVLDNIWSIDLWTWLQDALPNVNNGSRVLITTRFINIAKEADTHVLKPLNEEESKQLLLKKIFPNQFAKECPNDVLPIVTQFTKKCGGWPLPLLVVGGILSKKKPDNITWDEVMQKMDWQTHGSRFMGVISTSFEDLPTALKLCFMYFCVFPEDYQIKATTLIQLWIAEVLIPEDGTKLLEDIAESYLEELVQRCMVQVSRRSCRGKINYCHIHVLLRELAIQKAMEYNYLTVVLKNDTRLSYSTCARRVALHDSDDKMIELACTDLRSLISFVHLPNFKSETLRVLHISTEPVLHISTEPYGYLTGRNNWTALKYFGFECSLHSYYQLPTDRFSKRSHLISMNNVQMVRTCFCKSHDELTPSFWGNKQLRHINITCCILCEAAPEGPPSAADLQSLLTLKGVRARQDWVAELPKFPNIRKLGIFIPEDISGEPLINLLSKLSNLNHLGSLNLKMVGGSSTFPDCISPFSRDHNCLHSFSLEGGIWPRKQVDRFPLNLVKLKLEYFYFEEDPMPQLEKLSNLRVLKLSGKIEAADGAADGKQMICSEGGFAHLKELLLCVRNLEEWKINEGAMPMLNQLVLKSCWKLQIVPDVQYLVNLKEFTVHHCLDQFNSRLQEDKSKTNHIPSVQVFSRMARERPRRPPPPDSIDDPIPVDSTAHFSPLLWIPHSEHRVSLASRESMEPLESKYWSYGLQYYSMMDPYLRHLGLSHLVNILETESRAINASLIQGLVERWRPETHTFHLPFGEMTVTLQDVSALWGLPIQGVPVGGISDPTNEDTINDRLADLLGAERDICDNGGRSRFHVKKTALRALFANRGLHCHSTVQDIERYTRAFVMDLFVSIMFADSSGDAIPMIYLELLRDLGPSSRYNWGGAVLAHLYSSLCHACKPKSKQMYGPTLLLQHWSWSRIPVAVPVPNESLFLGEPDDAYRLTFRKKWYGDHRYVDVTHGKPADIRLVRSQLQSLGDTQVSWTPYGELYNEGRLPHIVSDDKEMWLYKGPLVYFWIVEHHYPDRVLRQFGLPPLIPVDPDIPRSTIMKLHGTAHGNHNNRDWSTHYQEHYDRAASMSENLWQMSGGDGMQFQGSPLLRYQAWYLRVGMASVYLEGDYGNYLRAMIFEDDGYTPTGRKGARDLLLAIKGAAYSIICLRKRGYRAFGHTMLNLVAPCIEGHGHQAKLVTMLRDAGEDINWRRVQKDEPDEPAVHASQMPPVPTSQPEWDYHRWVLGMSGWHGFFDGHDRSVLPQGPAYMPTASEIQPMRESPEIHPTHDEILSFSPTDLAGSDQWDTAGTPSPRQPYPERAHDWEASGSGTHPDYGS